MSKEFWQERFKLGKEYLDYIFSFLEDKEESHSAEELAEKAVKLFLEKGEWIPEEYKDSKVFSYTGSYNEGDKIIFKKIGVQKDIEPSFGTIKKVENRENFPFQYGQNGRTISLEKCDVITIVFPNGEWQRNICNSSDYVDFKQRYLTPEEIVNKFKDIILDKVNVALTDDERFSKVKEKWVLTPPREIVNTLTDKQIDEGSVKITSGLKAMLKFYSINSEVSFIAYGGYIIRGSIDWNLSKIYSKEIKYWYEENHLTQGDKIYITAPENKDKNLAIYTGFERNQTDILRSEDEDKENREKLNLRHEIYKLLKDIDKFLHLKEILNQLIHSLGREVRLNTASSVLHSNSHLFKKIDPITDLWGLKSWEASDGTYRLDTTSLLLAIKEDDLVYKILEFKGIFMSAKEIAEGISKYFHVSKKEIIESTFIDFNDPRIVRDKCGKFGLKIWVEEWNQKLRLIEDSLEKVRDLEENKDINENKLRQINKELENLTAEKKRIEIYLLDIKKKEKILTVEMGKFKKGLEKIIGHTEYLNYRQNINKLKKENIAIFLLCFATVIYIYIFRVYSGSEITRKISYGLAVLILFFLCGFVCKRVLKFSKLKSKFRTLIKQENQIREEIRKAEFSQRDILEENNKNNKKVQDLENSLKDKKEEKLALERVLYEINSELGNFNKVNLLSEKIKYEKFVCDTINI